jgi:protein ImuB
MVICLLKHRFALLSALGDERQALLSEPVALAPEHGKAQVIGEVSASAEAHGVLAGMRLGEAMARCPRLRLVPPDPQAVRERWAGTLDRLESIGAAVESDRPGEAYFESATIEGLHGGHLEGVLAAVRSTLSGDENRADRGKQARRLGGPKPRADDPERRRFAVAGGRPRIGVAPTRFSAYAAALRARPRRGAEVVPAGVVRAFLAPLPVSLLRVRPELEELPLMLERLGIQTLGRLAALPPSALAERFGPQGLLALDLAQGRDTPLDPRRPPEPVLERLALPEAASGLQLERALELLIARVLARAERRGRTLRSLALSARFVEGGGWRTRCTLRRPSADPARLRLALAAKLAELPAPAESLALEVEAFGPPVGDQGRLVEERDTADARRRRLGEAVRQARQAAGREAALRVLELDPGSRLPERWAALAPFPVDGDAR